MLNKRGISPLIATVLIIGFTIVLAVLVIAWLSGVFTTQLETSDCTVELQEYCGSLTGMLEFTAEQVATTGVVTVDSIWLGDSTTEPDSISVALRDADKATYETLTLSTWTNNVATGTSGALAATITIAEARVSHTPIVPGKTCEIDTCAPIAVIVEQI